MFSSNRVIVAATSRMLLAALFSHSYRQQSGENTALFKRDTLEYLTLISDARKNSDITAEVVKI